MNANSDNLGGMNQQHKRLSELVAQACKALKDERGSDELGTVLAGLLCFMKSHFSQEEELMRRYGYKGLELHAQTHRMLFDRLAELTGETFNNLSALTKERLLVFLEQDLSYHIIEDMYDWEVSQFEKRFADQRLYEHESQLDS